jgi:hypothetical protein
MKAKWLLSIIAVIALVLSVSPGIALAATEDSAGGSFTTGNATPSVTSVALLDLADEGVTTMTPYVEYKIVVTVSDTNTLNDIKTLEVWVYYDADGDYAESTKEPAANTQTAAKLSWTASGGVWAIAPTGGGTTWAIVEGNCSTPDPMTASSDDFIFAFKPGKVAYQTTGDARWHIHAKATDEADATGTGYQENRQMAWYGEISVATASVDWGSVNPGTDFGESTKETAIEVTYIGNGNYAEKIAASSSWSGDPSGTATLDADGSPSANEFSIKAARTDSLPEGSNGLITASPTYLTIGEVGERTAEAGVTVDTNTLWLKLGTPFAAATYSGTIYYQITTR